MQSFLHYHLCKLLPQTDRLTGYPEIVWSQLRKLCQINNVSVLVRIPCYYNNILVVVLQQCISVLRVRTTVIHVFEAIHGFNSLLNHDKYAVLLFSAPYSNWEMKITTNHFFLNFAMFQFYAQKSEVIAQNSITKKLGLWDMYFLRCQNFFKCLMREVPRKFFHWFCNFRTIFECFRG